MNEHAKKFKWAGTVFVLTGILLTNLNIYPANIVIHGLGAVFFIFVGYLAKDKAIMTNFSLQLPLFAVGLVNAFAVN